MCIIFDTQLKIRNNCSNFTLGDEDKNQMKNKNQRPISPMEVTEDDYTHLLKNHRRKKQECNVMVGCVLIVRRNNTVKDLISFMVSCCHHCL